MILRKSEEKDLETIWIILQDAITQRKNDGSSQWQDGYPNPTSIKSDYANGYGYVLESEDSILAYAAIIFDIEPAYNDIKGEWLTERSYVVVHRVATSQAAKGKGLAKKLFLMIEDLAKERNVWSVKVDTNFDNGPMLHILDKLDYIYCGEVEFRGSSRKAFEKKLD
jgi:GNAT superfamily N-acetyltransferase